MFYQNVAMIARWPYNSMVRCKETLMNRRVRFLLVGWLIVGSSAAVAAAQPPKKTRPPRWYIEPTPETLRKVDQLIDSVRDARGPLAGMYHSMVPDIYGDTRLDVRQTEPLWDAYQQQAAAHFDFDDQQKSEALKAHDRAVAQLEFYLASIDDDHKRYVLDARHLDHAMQDRSTASVNFRSTWIDTEEKRLDRQLNPWLKQIDSIWDRYEREINDIAAAGMLQVGDKQVSQRQYYGFFPLPRAGTAGVSSALADRVLPWFTFIVGVLLVLGLFTRIAALGGAAFLLSVIATQPPWIAAAADTNYQIVLLLGLLVCAAIGAGRWGGLDFFLGLAWSNCCKNAVSDQRSAVSQAT
jgi:uncharacterized membrane protein YphA (DoxX/SURF4 family)